MSVAAKRITPSDGEDAVNAAAVPERHPALERVDAPIAGGPDSSPDGSPESLDDGVLLEGVAGGDAAAFAALMQRHLSAVLATARRIVRDETEAEDIAQEAFLRLWNMAQTLEPNSYGMRPWLSRVASNLAIDRLRKAKRLDVTDDVPEQLEEAGQLHALEAAEVSKRVEQALAGLPARQRIAVSLFHFDEMSQREVAALMELSEDALESLLARGRRRLRDFLREDWQDLLIQSGGGT